MAKLTDARRRGLLVAEGQQAEYGRSRISNVTDEAAGYVYWQTARWLVDEELAVVEGEFLALTDAGRRLAQAVGPAADEKFLRKFGPDTGN
jgi:hypothetical protein